MTPMIDGKLHYFGARGLYDGLFLLGDHETGSYWNHITGECMHGPLKGQRLPVFELRQMTAAQALAAHPEARFAHSQPSLLARFFTRAMRFRLTTRRGFLPPHFRSTMGAADERRPRMDMGLGVWTDGARRYYPLAGLRAQGGALVDEFDGRSLLLYIDPLSRVPGAFYTTATAVSWQGDELHLDSGGVVRNGMLYNEQGERQPAARPLQLFTRWYGFAYTFPGCEIYGGE